MHKKLRDRILRKIAQTQPQGQTKVLPPPPAVPGVILSQLPSGYNNATVTSLKSLTDKLNIALHYSSDGEGSFQDIMNNNLDLSGADNNFKNIGTLSKMFYDTFLNRKNPFTKKIEANQIHNWADSMLSSSPYNSLTQIPATSPLSSKIGGNLRDIIFDNLTSIKNQNPVA